MELRKKTLAALNEFRPQLEEFSNLWKVSVVFLILCVAFGLYALYVQITQGHIVTGMRDHVVWGVYISNFIFFIGISYAGAVISGVFHLLKIRWRRPVIRIALMMTIVAAIIGPFFIILCVGRFDRLHYLVIHARLQSPIVWDVFAIGTFLVGAILFLYLTLIKDFAIYRDFPDLKIANWQKRFYSFMALGYNGLPSQKKQIAGSLNLLAFLIIPMVIVVSSVLSWIFGMTLRPGWHSTIFGPYFVLASIYSGVGVIIMLMWVFRKTYNLQNYIKGIHFSYMGYVMVAFAAAYGYLTFSEYLTDWYGSETWHAEVLNKLFSYSEYGGWFVFANVAGIILPILIVAIPATRKPDWIAFASLVMVFAMWVKRYLIVVPTLETPLIPTQDLRPEYVYYSATWVEWALTFGGFATFLLFYMLVSKFVTIIPVSEMAGGDPEFGRHPSTTVEEPQT